VVNLVPFEVARRHLRTPDSADMDDILLKLEIASEEILGYLRGNTSIEESTMDGWTEASEDIPAMVINAVLLRLTYLYEHRGDDPRRDVECWDSIERCLMRLRTPAVSSGTRVS
jgi:hypothetical protein